MSNSYKLPLSAEQLISKARGDTEIDIVDHDVITPLTVLVKSLNDESDLHENGAKVVQTRILQMLKNRLRMFRDFRDHPEIAEQEVKSPIMISGTLRTGSTKLQKIFSEPDDFNWLPFWKVHNFASYTGRPNEDNSARIADAEDFLAYNDKVSPEIRLAHVHETYEPEEDSLIAHQSFICASWFAYGNIPSYLQWVSKQDMTPTYKFVRDALKYLQWQGLADPNKRWLLKSPFNVGLEDVIRRVFPDASFVVTHRPPYQTLPSMFSLLSAWRKCHSYRTQVDGLALATGQALTLERHLQIREANPAIPVIDIHYKESTTDMENVIRRVYKFIGEPLSDESLQRMLNWEANNPMHKHGTHNYSLTDYSLTEKQIADLCPNYMSFYEAQFGESRS